MGKSRKSKKSTPLVSFSLEADAARIFEEYLENDSFPPDAVEPADDENLKTKGRQKRVMVEADLHGMTVQAAKWYLKSLMAELMKKKAAKLLQVRVITGKGRHSVGGGGVLVREIYDFVKDRYSDQISQIDPCPADDVLNGLPLKGYFDFYLRLP